MLPVNLVLQISLLFKKADDGVDYEKSGAMCPGCNEKIKIYKTMPLVDGVRVRYHKCENKKCVICATGKSIKSIQVG